MSKRLSEMGLGSVVSDSEKGTSFEFTENTRRGYKAMWEQLYTQKSTVAAADLISAMSGEQLTDEAKQFLQDISKNLGPEAQKIAEAAISGTGGREAQLASTIVANAKITGVNLAETSLMPKEQVSAGRMQYSIAKATGMDTSQMVSEATRAMPESLQVKHPPVLDSLMQEAEQKLSSMYQQHYGLLERYSEYSAKGAARQEISRYNNTVSALLKSTGQIEHVIKSLGEFESAVKDNIKTLKVHSEKLNDDIKVIDKRIDEYRAEYNALSVTSKDSSLTEEARASAAARMQTVSSSIKSLEQGRADILKEAEQVGILRGAEEDKLHNIANLRRTYRAIKSTPALPGKSRLGWLLGTEQVMPDGSIKRMGGLFGGGGTLDSAQEAFYQTSILTHAYWYTLGGAIDDARKYEETLSQMGGFNYAFTGTPGREGAEVMEAQSARDMFERNIRAGEWVALAPMRKLERLGGSNPLFARALGMGKVALGYGLVGGLGLKFGSHYLLGAYNWAKGAIGIDGGLTGAEAAQLSLLSGGETAAAASGASTVGSIATIGGVALAGIPVGILGYDVIQSNFGKRMDAALSRVTGREEHFASLGEYAKLASLNFFDRKARELTREGITNYLETSRFAPLRLEGRVLDSANKMWDAVPENVKKYTNALWYTNPLTVGFKVAWDAGPMMASALDKLGLSSNDPYAGMSGSQVATIEALKRGAARVPGGSITETQAINAAKYAGLFFGASNIDNKTVQKVLEVIGEKSAANTDIPTDDMVKSLLQDVAISGAPIGSASFINLAGTEADVFGMDAKGEVLRQQFSKRASDLITRFNGTQIAARLAPIYKKLMEEGKVAEANALFDRTVGFSTFGLQRSPYYFTQLFAAGGAKDFEGIFNEKRPWQTEAYRKGYALQQEITQASDEFMLGAQFTMTGRNAITGNLEYRSSFPSVGMHHVKGWLDSSTHPVRGASGKFDEFRWLGDGVEARTIQLQAQRYNLEEKYWDFRHAQELKSFNLQKKAFDLRMRELKARRDDMIRQHEIAQSSDAYDDYQRGMSHEIDLLQRQWRREDIQRNIYRASVQYGWQMDDFGKQSQRIEQQYQWQMQDFAENRQTFEMQAGWQLEDMRRAMRYASGRQRIDLRRQYERQIIMNQLSRNRMDTQEARASTIHAQNVDDLQTQIERFKQLSQWKREDAQRELERLDRIAAIQDEMWNKESEHIIEMRKLRDENYERDLGFLEEHIKQEQDSWKLKEENFKEQRKYQEDLNELNKDGRDLEMQKMIFAFTTKVRYHDQLLELQQIKDVVQQINDMFTWWMSVPPEDIIKRFPWLWVTYRSGQNVMTDEFEKRYGVNSQTGSQLPNGTPHYAPPHYSPQDTTQHGVHYTPGKAYLPQSRGVLPEAHGTSGNDKSTDQLVNINSMMLNALITIANNTGELGDKVQRVARDTIDAVFDEATYQ